MNFVDFIIHVSKNPEVSKEFIEKLKKVNAVDEVKKLLDEYTIIAAEADVNKIFLNKDAIANMQTKVIEPLY